MKKVDLIEECKRLGLDFDGKITDLKDRIKNARVQREESVEDIFKKYEQEIDKS
jgi:DNA polymerase delta subunit 1